MRLTRSIQSLLALALVAAACQSSPEQYANASSSAQPAKPMVANEAPSVGILPQPQSTPPADNSAVTATGTISAEAAKPVSAEPMMSKDDAIAGGATKDRAKGYGGSGMGATMDPFVTPSPSKKAAAPTAKPIGPRPPTIVPTPPLTITTPPVPPPPPKADYANSNAFYENTYQGGSGARDRIEDLIANGVMVDGKSVPLDALASDYRQPFPLPFDRAISLEAATEYRALEAKGGRTVLQVGLQGMETETPRRPPLRLSLVIDVSGSMKKEDRMIKVKDAAQTLVSKLSKDDQIAIVAFESTAKIVCEMGAADRTEVKSAIESLTAGGGTNIYDGLQYGYSQMSKLPTNDDGFRVVLLFSDGEVTAGEQDPMKFDELTRSAFASKIATTTFGVGLSFNEKLMMNISVSGKGNYHFLKDAAAADKAINGELEDYTQVVASDVLVRVKLASGVKLIRMYGAQELDAEQTAKVKADEEMLDDRAQKDLGIKEDRTKDDEDGIKTLIPQFYLGDAHVILMEVEVPAGAGVRQVAEVFLKYKDSVFTRNGTEKETVTIETAPTADAQIRSLDSSVKKNILGFETGEALIESAEALREGKTLEAAKRLDDQRQLLANAASSWVDDDLRRDAELMGKYQEVVASLGNRNMSGTDEGEALAKAFVFSGYQLKK
jgi:Ca-activated chloride channel family protein